MVDSGSRGQQTRQGLPSHQGNRARYRFNRRSASAESPIDQLQHASGQGRVVTDDLTDFAIGRIRRLQQLADLGHALRQGMEQGNLFGERTDHRWLFGLDFPVHQLP